MTTIALTADGAVWSWGEGGSGKLGHGDQQLELLPKKVEKGGRRGSEKVGWGVQWPTAR